ncbi:hypothetical protein B0H13DRAFT_2662284 [Mycena leptocephala]|nr:hypothetical protein B0H13DRAFT_2662284 [Mycena leptocephala]
MHLAAPTALPEQALALTFEPIIGPFVTDALVPIEWTLDGSEPLNGWELWFDAGGSGIKLANIVPLSISTTVPFPGSNGTFQGISGTVVLATSNEVDLATPPTIITATTTFSASVISGPSTATPSSSRVVSGSSSSVDIAVTPTSSPSSVTESATPSKGSAFSTAALLAIVVATLVVIAIIAIASIALFVHRRRRAAAASDAYPFDASDVEKQLAQRITPFHAKPPPITYPPRGSSLPPLPISASSFSGVMRQAFLNAQLQKLEVTEQNPTNPESASIVFGPLSPVPSEAMPQPFSLEAEPPPTSPPLPTIPESSSRRTAYLTEQLQRLEVVERRPSDGSVVFGPLSSVPSEGTARLYAPSVSTVGQSPIQFLRHAPSEMTSPVSPVMRVAPW